MMCNSLIQWDPFDHHTDQMRWNASKLHRINLYSSHKSIFRFISTLLSIEINLSVNFEKWNSHTQPLWWNWNHFHRMNLYSSHQSRIETLVTPLFNEINLIITQIRWDETLRNYIGSTYIHLTKLYSDWP